MKKVIYISRNLGADLRTRSFFRRDIEKLIVPFDGDILLDFDGVDFISRSVADEICNLLEDYPMLSITGMDGDVEMMYKVVVSGRSKPREYPKMNVKVYHLKNMKELSDFLFML